MPVTFGQGVLERIGLFTIVTSALGKCDVEGKLFPSLIQKTFLWTVNFYFIFPQNHVHIMKTFLYYIKNETLNKIETSLKVVPTKDPVIRFFQYPLVLIPKRKCLVGAGRIGCGESGILAAINLCTMKQSAKPTWMSCSYGSSHGLRLSMSSSPSSTAITDY